MTDESYFVIRGRISPAGCTLTFVCKDCNRTYEVTHTASQWCTRFAFDELAGFVEEHAKGHR